MPSDTKFTSQLTCMVPFYLKEQVAKLAISRDIHMSQYIIEAIKEKMQRDKNNQT